MNIVMVASEAREVDGGINDKTLSKCVKNGAGVLVVGSYLFNHPDYIDRFKKINA